MCVTITGVSMTINKNKQSSQPSLRRVAIHVAMHFVSISFLVSTTFWVGGNTAQAQTCGGEHSVISGESISRIADTYYQDWQKWSVIYNVNLETVGDDPNLILIGQKLRQHQYQHQYHCQRWYAISYC